MRQDNSIGSVLVDQNDNTLVYAMPYDFSEYSAYTANSYATAQWQSSVINGLYKRSASAGRDWVPDLAAALPIISADKKTFTVDLKTDLTFSNGDPLTADDVVFSFKVAMTPGINTNFYGGYVGFMNNNSIVKIDRDTVEITFLQSFAFPFGFLATPLIPEETFGIIYDSCIDGTSVDCVWDNEDLYFTISAGPYKATFYDETNQAITVVKNNLYYGWNDGSATGNIDAIVFKKTSEKAAVIAELVEGSIDIMDAQYIPGLDELAFFSRITEVYVGDLAHQEVSLNHLHPMYGTGKGIPGLSGALDADAWAAALKVRTAMSYVVDRDYAVNEVSNGLAQPAATPMPSAMIGWDPTLIPLSFDIDAAKNLMEEAGFDYDELTDADNDGVYETFFFEVTILSPNTSPRRNEWSPNFVAALPGIGIGVKEHVSTGWAEIIPRTFGWSGTGEALVALYDDGGFDILFVGLGWGFDYNPQGLYDATGRHDTTGGGNFYNFDVDEVQTEIGSLIRDYLSELDFQLRIDKVKLIQAELYKFKPVLPILYPQSHWGFNSDLGGYDALLMSISATEWELMTKGKDIFESEEPELLTIVITVPGNTTTVRPPAKSTSYDAPGSWAFGLSLIILGINRKRNRNLLRQV